MHDWIQTATGRPFWPLKPQPEDVDILDIAHALSMKCRYGGHCRFFYSVAEHSILVSKVVSREHALWGLLHDAAEAYLADVPRPVKPLLVGWHDIEARVMRVVCERFGLPEEEPEAVKVADTAVLLAEQKPLMGEPPMPWGIPGVPANVLIQGFAPGVAKMAFLRRFYELTGR